MTVQTGDILNHGKARYSVRPFPLAVLGEGWRTVPGDGGHSNRAWIMSTACRRGYVAAWKIENDRLFLVRIKGGLPSLNMQSVFGTDRQFAFWFSGQLRSPFGQNIGGKFEVMCQFDHLWQFEFGVLTARTIRHNVARAQRAPSNRLRSFIDTI